MQPSDLQTESLIECPTRHNYYPIAPPQIYYETVTIFSLDVKDLIDGAAFIGVGFDGRGDYSPESRKMSIVQRVCAGKVKYVGFITYKFISQDHRGLLNSEQEKKLSLPFIFTVENGEKCK